MAARPQGFSYRKGLASATAFVRRVSSFWVVGDVPSGLG